MSDLRDLYQQVILDHNRKPRNFHAMPDADREAEGFNPLCGDKVRIYVRLEGDRIADLSFQGEGCAISTASASLMTQALKGKTVHEAEEAFEAFRTMVTEGSANPEKLGKLAVFGGVCEFPLRVKCATLAWHTLHAALARQEGTVTTE